MPLIDELLERQLVEAVRDPELEVDDPEAVRERLLGVPVAEAARDLVGQGEAEPDGHLAPEITPTTWQTRAALRLQPTTHR